MSSHHIVREKQEPALLILDVGNFPYEFLGQLLEWSPTVIATPGSFEELYSSRIKIDWLITQDQPLELQNDIHIILSPTGNYLTDALNILVEKGYSAVNIVADSLNLVRVQDFVNKINIVIYSGREKIFPIKSGYQKWMPSGEFITIKIPDTTITTSGLKKVSDTELVTIQDGIIGISFGQEYLFIAEKL